MRESSRRQPPVPRADSLEQRKPRPPLTANLDSRFAHDFSRVAAHASTGSAADGSASPLPFLDRIQSSFGRFDVSHARAHLDSPAAKATGANAFTAGEDVSFAARPTLRTAAHEATHVLQQRAGVPFSGRGQRGDPFERQADAVAERVVQGRSSENLLSTIPRGTAGSGTAMQFDDPPKAPATRPASQPATQPATQPVAPPVVAGGDPLRYDRSWYSSLSVPDEALTEAWMESRMKKIFTTHTVKGIPVGAPKETRLFLLYLLEEVADRKNWGAEQDLVAPIAWPAKKGDPAPVGRVTVRIDKLGNASAELVAQGPVPKAPQTTLAAGSTLLIDTYHFSGVSDDGTATWSDSDISDVVEALKLLPPAEKDVLSGVELIRVKDIPGKFAGLFASGGVSPADPTTVIKPSLKLANAAFDAEKRFYGGTKGTVPSSFYTIVHEVGHAVEEEKYRPLAEAYNTAAVKSNKLGKPVQESADEHKKLSADYAKLYPQYDAAKKAGDATKTAKLETQLLALQKKIDAAYARNVAANKKYKPVHKTAEDAKQKMKKTLVDPTAIVKPLETDAAAKKVLATDAIAKIAPVRAALPQPQVTGSQPFMDEIDKTTKAIETFSTSAKDAGKIEPLEEPVLRQIETRNLEAKKLALAAPAHPALASMKLAAEAQDVWFSAERTAARAPHRTLHLQSFVDLVTAKKIEPFTDYAKKNWPHNPAEFYAEAYALWRTDPDFLSDNYKPVFDYFESGDYRK